jgi:hypothetical protein
MGPFSLRQSPCQKKNGFKVVKIPVEAGNLELPTKKQRQKLVEAVPRTDPFTIR